MRNPGRLAVAVVHEPAEEDDPPGMPQRVMNSVGQHLIPPGDLNGYLARHSDIFRTAAGAGTNCAHGLTTIPSSVYDPVSGVHAASANVNEPLPASYYFDPAVQAAAAPAGGGGAAGRATGEEAAGGSGHLSDDGFCEWGCPICLCAEGYEATINVVVMPCKHQFHASCISKWRAMDNPDCPLCRTMILHVSESVAGRGGE